MIYTSLFIELIRTRPRVVFWSAALAQALIWTLVPAIFYSAPPGNVAEVLAVGHEFRLGTNLGPPLAYWLAELAYNAAGGRLIGVYALAQLCVVVTYWAVFALGRSIVGEAHAMLAVLLLVGVSAMTVATPNFGPEVATMPLWALALLHYWRAVGEGRGAYWFALALDIGLLLLTAYMGLVLVALLVIFTLVTERGRAQLELLNPYAAGVLATMILFPHLVWIDQVGDIAWPRLEWLLSKEAADTNLATWLRLDARLIATHMGLAILVALAAKLWVLPRGVAPEIDRAPPAPFARSFVFYFALLPALAMTLFAVIAGQRTIIAGPLLVLSGLAVIVAARDRIHIHYQKLVQFAWFALLILPPAAAAGAVVAGPWLFASELRVAHPMHDMGRFFAESFERRTGRPLPVVTGDPHLAAVVALGAPSRPALHVDVAPASAASVGREELALKGGIVVWPATDPAGTPPPEIRSRFPDIVAETPRAFERPIQGRLPLLRVGWAVIRPQGEGAAPPARPGS
jgi:hypothetical protein